VKSCVKNQNIDNLCYPIFEDDVQNFSNSLPHLTQENAIAYYTECYRIGIHPYVLAKSMGGSFKNNNYSKLLRRLANEPQNYISRCINSRTWEEAQLMTNGWYHDLEFHNCRSVEDLIMKENTCAIKSCLSICAYWIIPVEVATHFLFLITGISYPAEKLNDLGRHLIKTTMAFYKELNYSKSSKYRTSYCNNFFPRALVDNRSKYFQMRNFDNFGFPI
jgi:aldehyde:ferredoxin oxidoreductase